MNFTDLVRLAGKYGGYEVARLITRNQPKILMYHRFSKQPRKGFVSAGTFEKQVATIARHYKPVTVKDLVINYFDKANTPNHMIAITVDDGYRDFYEIAWPILRRYKVPATFYITSGFINRTLWLWPDQLKWLLNNSPRQSRPINAGDMIINSPTSDTDREKLFADLVEYLLSVEDNTKHRFIESLSKSWDIPLPPEAPPGYEPASWKQLKEMQDDGMEIGGHTITHPSLGRVGFETARSEISGCQKILNEKLGEVPRTFCYPNGSPKDFVGKLVPIIRDSGFVGAVVAFADSQGQKQRFALRRHASGENMFQFNKAVSGVEILGHKLRLNRQITAYE